MKKYQNKGFTLVELIIVVAVIAILAGVLAPQYLQYVERTRESNDLQIATNLMKAVTVVVADPENNVPAGEYFAFRWDTSTSTQGPSPSGGTGGLTAEFRNNAASTEWLENIESQIYKIMGYDATSTTVGESMSALSKTEDLLFRINTSTGVIEVHTWYADTWVDGIGIDADVATF